jgi:hypothetical protein
MPNLIVQTFVKLGERINVEYEEGLFFSFGSLPSFDEVSLFSVFSFFDEFFFSTFGLADAFFGALSAISNLDIEHSKSEEKIKLNR